jgi:hypothetical protein
LPKACIIEKIDGQDNTLVDELTGPTYSYSGEDMEIQLERKKDMRRRGVPSPNVADALACTFAYSVYTPMFQGLLEEYGNFNKPHVEPDYDPFSRDRMMN